MLLLPGLHYRVAIALARDNVVTGTTGNFSASRCQIVVTIHNQNGAAPPF
jgi:hypothetical protein